MQATAQDITETKINKILNNAAIRLRPSEKQILYDYVYFQVIIPHCVSRLTEANKRRLRNIAHQHLNRYDWEQDPRNVRATNTYVELININLQHVLQLYERKGHIYTDLANCQLLRP
jgi:hypothetical protein